MLLLAINPGSTSTKVAVFEGDRLIFQKNLQHNADEFSGFSAVVEQKDARKAAILEELETAGYRIGDFTAVVGRGGFMKPLPGGVYRISEEMLADLSNKELWGREHASNLGAFIARELAEPEGIPSFIVDPVTVDEMEEIARVSGVPFIKRKSIFHALNTRACAYRAAAELGKRLEDCNFIAIHMGGGISVTAIRQGRCIDVNNALLGMGPFTPQRAGALPVGDLIETAYSGTYSKKELLDLLSKRSGLIAYTGTDSGLELERRINSGDEQARFAVEAMAYQVAKEAGAMAAVLEGRVDAVVVTGGLAYMEVCLMSTIRRKLGYLGRMFVYPGEGEMKAMAEAVLRVLEGRETPKEYGDRA